MVTWSIAGVLSRTYARDANGNVTAIEAVGYGYGALDRMVTEPGQTFAWDANGNRFGDARGAYTYTQASNRMERAHRAGDARCRGQHPHPGPQAFGYNTTRRLAEVYAPGTPLVTFRSREDVLRSSCARGWVWDDEGRPVAMLEGT